MYRKHYIIKHSLHVSVM